MILPGLLKEHKGKQMKKDVPKKDQLAKFAVGLDNTAGGKGGFKHSAMHDSAIKKIIRKKLQARATKSRSTHGTAEGIID